MLLLRLHAGAACMHCHPCCFFVLPRHISNMRESSSARNYHQLPNCFRRSTLLQALGASVALAPASPAQQDQHQIPWLHPLTIAQPACPAGALLRMKSQMGHPRTAALRPACLAAMASTQLAALDLAWPAMMGESQCANLLV